MNRTTTRRRFFGGAAILAGPVAAAAAVGGDDLAARLAALEDTNAIRALLQDWARSVNAGAPAADDAHVCKLTLDANATIDLTVNGTATARVACTVETATPIAGDETFVAMARLQGDGVVRHNERRVLAGRFIKRNEIWLLEHTELTV